VLHQGPLFLARGASNEVQHFIIYKDRLEHFVVDHDKKSGFDAGNRRTLRPSEVREVRVLDRGFVLTLEDESLELTVPPHSSMDRWVQALRQALDPEGAAADISASTSSTALPVSEEASSIAPEHGREEELDASCFRPLPLLEANLSTATASPDVSDTGMGEWLESMPERPLRQGLLGFQERGRAVARYCVLFRNRIEAWESRREAARGARPVLCIPMTEVRGLEILGSGFLLTAGARRIGIHVKSNEDLQAWTRALLSVLSPGDAATASSQETSGLSARTQARGSTPTVRWSGSGSATGTRTPPPPTGSPGPAMRRSQSMQLRGSPRQTPATSMVSARRGSAGTPKPTSGVPRGSTSAARGASPGRRRESEARSSAHSIHDLSKSPRFTRPQGRDSVVARKLSGARTPPAGRASLNGKSPESRAFPSPSVRTSFCAT